MSSRSVNKVLIIGNLGGDPELRHTASNVPVTNFTVATSESWTNKDGERQERTEWHRVVAWRKLAEICNEYLRKGTQVYIEGKLQTRSWESQSGEKHYMTEVIADEMVMLGGKGETCPAFAEQATAPYDQPPAATDENDDLPF
jgi:single-strand DNA-binding protein